MSPRAGDSELPGQVPGPGPQPAIREEEPAGEAGSVLSRPTESLVDPTVSRAKFDREIANYRRMDREYLRRGWMLVHAEFPAVIVLFAAPQLKPKGVVFGVVVDFSNYDLWAPSVKFVDPFTLEPLRADQVQLLKRPRNVLPGVPAGFAMDEAAPVAGDAAPGGIGQDGVPHDVPDQIAMPFMVQMLPPAPPQNLVQAHSDGKPFLCMRGVREYHDHPFHSNDPWLAHRGTGVGTLYHILDVIHRHGIVPLNQWAYNISVNIECVGAGLNPSLLPE
jgi:putative metal binding uncharacterized protein